MLISLPAALFAGTLFEDNKRTSDPYIADRGGFNSLFVNPAGAAGQSGFELAINVGGASTSNDIKLITSVADMAMAMDSDQGLTGESLADVGQTLSDLYDSGVISDALIDSIFDTTAGTMETTSIDWSDPAQVQAAAEAMSQAEIDEVVVNVEGIMDGSNTAFFNALPGEISIDAVASFKTGFLIKGWGLGVYDHAVGVAYMDPVDQTYGLKSLYNELGVVAGGGFNILDGKWAIGVSGNYGVLTKSYQVSFENFDQLINGSINYGYTWGVDAGVIWRPTPALGVGLVVNDIIGYTEADAPRTAAGFQGFFDDSAYLMDELKYEVTTDFDMGVSWQPDWRFVKPKLGVDIYNVIGYGRAVSDENDDFEDAMYRLLGHMRLGANFTFFDFLKVGAQYHNNYISAGLGLDLLFLELYGEFKIQDKAVHADDVGDVPIGADLMVRVHF